MHMMAISPTRTIRRKMTTTTVAMMTMTSSAQAFHQDVANGLCAYG